MNRYVISYFEDPSETFGPAELTEIFIEGTSEEDAKTRFLSKFGAFSEIVSCNLTKSCGGSGLSESSVNISQNVFYKNVELEEVTTPEPVVFEGVLAVKQVKTTTRSGKTTKASQVREKVAEAKFSGLDQNFVVDWAITNLGQTNAVAKAYVKVIWAE